MICPVTHPASSLARNAIRRAASSGCPIRPIGERARIYSLTSPVIHPVSVGPGSTAFTVIPRGATSAANVVVKASIAPFVATYASFPGSPPHPPAVTAPMRENHVTPRLCKRKTHRCADAPATARSRHNSNSPGKIFRGHCSPFGDDGRWVVLSSIVYRLSSPPSEVLQKLLRVVQKAPHYYNMLNFVIGDTLDV